MLLDVSQQSLPKLVSRPLIEFLQNLLTRHVIHFCETAQHVEIMEETAGTGAELIQEIPSCTDLRTCFIRRLGFPMTQRGREEIIERDMNREHPNTRGKKSKSEIGRSAHERRRKMNKSGGGGGN